MIEAFFFFPFLVFQALILNSKCNVTHPTSTALGFEEPATRAGFVVPERGVRYVGMERRKDAQSSGAQSGEVATKADATTSPSGSGSACVPHSSA